MVLKSFLVYALLSVAVLAASAAGASRPPIRGLLFNEDGNQRFMWDPAGTIKPERLDEFVDALANSQVKVMLITCCSQTTTHDTKAPGWSTFCSGFDPAKDNDQPFFGDSPKDGRDGLRRWAHNQRVLLDAGVCPMQRMIDRCRTKGISPWVSLRMNDVHDAPWTKSPLHSQFWKEHPQYWRRNSDPCGSWFDRCLNYGLKPVRDRMMALIREVCDRYDVDGLELDWLRFPAHFREGEEIEQGKALTEWMVEVRTAVRATAKKRKPPIWLMARVPARPDVSMGTGLDAVTWAKRGLIDHLSVGPFWATTDFDIPVEQWIKLLKGTGVGVTASLEALVQPYPGAPQLDTTTEQSRGAAMSALAHGSQGLYLFNYMGVGTSKPCLLRELGSIKTLAGKDRSYPITYPDISIPGKPIPTALPKRLAPLESAEFKLFIGPKPLATARGEIQLTLAPENPGEKCEVRVMLNRHLPAAGTGFTFDSKAFQKGYNNIRVVNAGTSAMTVQGVELSLRFSAADKSNQGGAN